MALFNELIAVVERHVDTGGGAINAAAVSRCGLSVVVASVRHLLVSEERARGIALVLNDLLTESLLVTAASVMAERASTEGQPQ